MRDRSKERVCEQDKAIKRGITSQTIGPQKSTAWQLVINCLCASSSEWALLFNKLVIASTPCTVGHK